MGVLRSRLVLYSLLFLVFFFFNSEHEHRFFFFFFFVFASAPLFCVLEANQLFFKIIELSLMKTKRKRWHLQIDAFLRIDKLLRCLLDSFFVTYIYISPFLYPRLILVSTSIYIYLFSSCRAVHSYTPVPRKRNKSWQRLISLSFTISCLSFFFFLNSITLFLRICRAISSRISLNRLGLSYDWLFFFFRLLLPPLFFFKGPFVFFFGAKCACIHFFFLKFLSQHFRLQLYVP